MLFQNHQQRDRTQSTIALTADPLGALWDIDAEQLLDGQRVGLLVTHHRHVVEPVEVGQRLRVGLVLDQLLSAAVQQADVRVGVEYRLGWAGGGGGGWSVVSGQWVPGYRGTPSPGLGAGHESAQVNSG